MKYHLLESLLPHLEAYERAYPQQQNPQHFAVWLARQTADEQHLADRNNPAPDHETTDVAITKLLMFLHRYARGYAKKPSKARCWVPWTSLPTSAYCSTMGQ